MPIQTRSSSYWDKRALARLTEAERNSDWHFREIKLLYEQAEKETVESLKKIYEAFYRQNQFDMSALERIVPTTEIEQFYNDLAKAGLSKYLPQRFAGRGLLRRFFYAVLHSAYLGDRMLSEPAPQGL